MLYGMCLVVSFVVFACVRVCVCFVPDVLCDVCDMRCTCLCLYVWWLDVFVCCLQLLVWCWLACVLCVIWWLCVWLCLCFVRDVVYGAVWCGVVCAWLLCLCLLFVMHCVALFGVGVVFVIAL